MSSIQQTALYPIHQKNHAKFVDFHHWMMPLHYGSAIQEHLAVRTDAGVFDVSHMTIIDLMGGGCRPFLRYLMTRDIDEIKQIGGACYSCMCNENAGIIDDVLIYYRAPDHYRLVFNAANQQKVIEWLHHHAKHFAVGIQERRDLAILAIQGPQALNKTLALVDSTTMDGLITLRRFHSLDTPQYFFSRTGYTGEDGLECILPANQACDFFEKFLHAGIPPCGLAARDSLRLEAGLLLSGQDMDEQTSPIACGLEWTVSWKDPTREFIGKAAMIREKQDHPQQQLVGLILDAQAILRPGQIVLCRQKPVGMITSGLYSPSLEKSIAFAKLQFATDLQTLEVEIRQTFYPIRAVSTRFYAPQRP